MVRIALETICETGKNVTMFALQFTEFVFLLQSVTLYAIINQDLFLNYDLMRNLHLIVEEITAKQHKIHWYILTNKEID